MRLEFINRVKENEVLGKSILTNEGSILLRAGIALSNQYINKLRELGVLYVYIEDDRLDDVMVEDERLIKLKQVTMKNMDKIVKNINNLNSKSDARNSLRVVENLIEYIIDSGDVNLSLHDIKTHDNYTYVHCIDTGIMAAFLGLSLKFKDDELKELGKGAILHDIGKTKISDKIINKKAPLNEEEFLEMKKHPIYGKQILEKNMSISEIVLRSVAEHHERIDGCGYPYGLKGNQISRYGKAVCICDVYDAISSDRSYRNKFSPNDAYELILAGNGTMFDEKMVEGFKDTFSVYPLGSCVKLSNDIEGYVIRQNPGFPDRPILRVLYDAETKAPIPFYEIDLLKHLDIVVKKVV